MSNENQMDNAAQWREEAGTNNPAGPLFAGDGFVESDIAGEASIITLDGCGTACTGSVTRYCC
ncbi:hypothetical protein GCM10027285_12070 [Oleiagrimonas citrea]|jgi:hypothetical protein|uniref:Uncharacterized protein n=1 Tax=Oleiagrimonas citrea TaxID=1665687 RepID=A0A846ZKY9_9GAMM|nr:DUF6229 family protein [Oleiagrimonas citrea]NKZ38233.1 hypothetical protein [Oleiagrimonas citrea]